MLAAVIVPGAELLLVGGRALDGQAALDLLDLEVDADLLPLLADHLGDLRVLHELAAERHDLDAQPALAVAAQAVALGVLLARPILSSISLAFLTSSVAHSFRYSGPGLYLLLSTGTTEPGCPCRARRSR